MSDDKTEVNPLVGERVCWLEDNTYATVKECVDRGAGVYVLVDDEGDEWTAFDDEFVLAD